ncbi:MAG: DUF134 domain-containing protein [Clostridia bacterium]|nr:DUF134 domain-containing protein [Clostridia bacterium]
MDNYDRKCADILRPLFWEWAEKGNLTQDEARAFWYKEYEKWSITKISLTLYCSESTVFRLLKSARKKLCKAI